MTYLSRFIPMARLGDQQPDRLLTEANVFPTFTPLAETINTHGLFD
jgi:hypothetical protein